MSGPATMFVDVKGLERGLLYILRVLRLTKVSFMTSCVERLPVCWGGGSMYQIFSEPLSL